MVDVSSPYYPYERVHEYTTLPRAEEIPHLLTTYLLDMPLKGYDPPDNNDYPRCRIAKRLIYDGNLPLLKPLPTLDQKQSIIYDPSRAEDPPNPKLGYRLFPLVYPSQAQDIGQTFIRIYMGRAVPISEYRVEQSVIFQILSSTEYDNNMDDGPLSRSYALSCDIIRALHGVNMVGVGTWYYNRYVHADCGLRSIHDDGNNVGYELTMGVTMMGNEQPVKEH